MSNTLVDETGGSVNISGDTGKISGKNFLKGKEESLKDKLYADFEFTDLEGKTEKITVKMNVTVK